MLPFLVLLRFVCFYGLGILAVAAAATVADGDDSVAGFVRGLRAMPSQGESWLSEDQRALKSWAALLTNETYNIKLNWLKLDNSTSPCGYYGVQCGEWAGETRIVKLDFSKFNFTGRMPTGLGSLTALRELSLAYNNFSGEVPGDLGQCVNLQSLDLSYNGFQGRLPGEMFAECQSLKSLNVSGNHLVGPVPPHLWTCRRIEEILLRDNNFTGELFQPGEVLEKLEKLEKLDVYLNELTGNLSDVLDAIGCAALTYIDLSFNRFSGAIPAALGSCTRLSYVNFQSNFLTGVIPAELGRLEKLHWLGLSQNGITGALPETLTGCQSLSAMDVSWNLLSGTLPRWLHQVTSLRFFVAHSNRLTGAIPVELAYALVLVHLDVGNNSLSGEIPPELGNLTALRFLRLARNHLTGSIPGSFGSLTALEGLDLSVNQLRGVLPASLGNLQSLLWLQLAENHLSGAIPPEMTQCRSLLWLNLRNNELSGAIPSNFFSLGVDAGAMFTAIREANDFPPIDLGECSLALSWIPGEDPPFENMAKNLKHNQCRGQWLDILKGKRVPLSYWELSNNSLTGPIPEPASLASNLSCILLSHNDLSGAIPPTFRGVPFYNIDVRHNRINGSIPDIFESLQPTLQSLQLSYNHLSGALPASLNKLSFLWAYNFSYNPDLEGPVPYNASFRNFDPSAWVNDSKLCRIPDATQIPAPQEMKSCVNSSAGPERVAPETTVTGFAKNLVLACTLIGVFGAILLFLLGGSVFLLFLKCRRLHTKQAAVFMDTGDLSDYHVYDAASPSGNQSYIPLKSFGASLKALTYSDLVAATDNFSSAKIIGDGGFGMVYKAKLADGTTVAIKKLVQDGAQGDREFRAEMETLGLIQHPNLVPLLGYCCRSRERLLVYKCLSNGSLDDWLYESEERAAVLTWPLRLRIAAGTAQGLAFLHHQCEPLIIHRDMKTSNILLDENFESCLTDFGLARLMDLHMSHVSTVVAGTPGYVPPEYGETWRATAKGDVYSFGVVMLELASGKRPIGPAFHGMESGMNLVAWVKALAKANRHMDAYDPVVARSGSTELLGIFLMLAVACTATEARQRPTMMHVTAQLEDLKVRQQQLLPPSQAPHLILPET